MKLGHVSGLINVIPARAGIQEDLGAGFRWDDEAEAFSTELSRNPIDLEQSLNLACFGVYVNPTESRVGAGSRH